MRLTFQCEDWSLVSKDLKQLVHIQWEEIALYQDEIPLDPDWERYEKSAGEGGIVVFTVRDAGELVGWHLSLIGTHPHYKSTVFAMQDLYYVLPEYRSEPTIGLRLFMEMEAGMRARGVKEMIGNTKTHFDKSPLFERLGWLKTGTIYTKVL